MSPLLNDYILQQGIGNQAKDGEYEDNNERFNKCESPVG
ncbi:hypothetical protein Tther_01867 [Tepidimonas thermarum]|uniref:Uncharacterized protein n=1 Tax=Tepidimonas thermarum TaxID=335431 RepID=A0A554WYZ2_9BURK|nr:hypothetical protein Tther_01867 [Tepidimonas thermarum]